jgi:hypothetical protein
MPMLKKPSGSLMANVAACEGCEKTLERWQTERTRLLSDGYDKRSSLDISIMLSFSGTRMTTDAQELLALLSTLPDGLSEAELIQCELPIANLHLCKATLLRTSLAYLNNKKRLTVLVPIREYVRNAHPPSAETKAVFLDYIIRTVELFSTYDARLALTWDLSTQVSTVVGNFQAVLVDALKEDGEKSEAILRSVVKLSHLMSVETATLCPLLDAVEKDVKQLQGRPIYGLFLIEKFWGSATGNLPGVEYEIAGANEYFERTGGIEKGRQRSSCH